MKNVVAAGVVVTALVVGGVWWSKSLQSKAPDVVARNGIHWHPELSIIIKGEKQVIPANIGIGAKYVSYPTFDPRMGMTAIHTHDDANKGIIHFEFSGIVRSKDITLGQFLKIWDKNIDSFGSNVQMTVNGEPNTELGDYVMRDGDKIELLYNS